MPTKRSAPDGDPVLPADPEFARRLSEVLTPRGSVTAAALAVGLTGNDPTQMVRRWKAGKSGIPYSRLSALADHLGKRLDELYPSWEERLDRAPRRSGRPAGRPGVAMLAEMQAATQAEVEALRADVDDLRARLEAMEAVEVTATLPARVTGAVADAAPARETTPRRSRRASDAPQD